MTVELCNALARSGAEVCLFAEPGPLQDNVDPRVVCCPGPSPRRMPRYVLHLARQLRRWRPSVVHAQGALASVLVPLATHLSGTAPVRVVTHHSRGFALRPRRLAAHLFGRASHHYVAISSPKVRHLAALGIEPERISLIPNFIDVSGVAARAAAADATAERERLGIGAEDYVAVIAGRIVPAKGVDRFIEIVDRVASWLDVALHGVILGDGPSLAEVRRQATDSRGTARFHFPGYQPDVVPYLALSDAALFPSSHPEVLPMFLIEALAVGLPIVCSDIEGNRAVLADGGGGYLVSGEDDEYGHCLMDVLGDPAVAGALARVGRLSALERFDRDTNVGRTIELYRQLCGEHPSPQPAEL